ncbi:hypothetical protein EHF33_11955 [Deinococcus psychrotolerans]|uniref:Uncharacterized protein n=1 Tax=Deinococcus psychrotolerans TaxID=2489213 RepID=A0A3G8YD89_9DEIO|nr:hypothetical protein [Deinococcus psychrotolerans]AZI43369.1 hypothetical protein EHF33_11955 [Deinococcus psychrotolerans]
MDGALQLLNSPAAIRLVDTPEALADAKAACVPAVLVYRVGKVDDLHKIPLTPVKISSLNVVRR